MFWWLNIYASIPLKQLDQYRYLKKYKKNVKRCEFFLRGGDEGGDA